MSSLVDLLNQLAQFSRNQTFMQPHQQPHQQPLQPQHQSALIQSLQSHQPQPQQPHAAHRFHIIYNQNMRFQYLGNNFREYRINNLDDVKDIQFCFYRNPNKLQGTAKSHSARVQTAKLYIYTKRQLRYFIAITGKLYVFNRHSCLVPAVKDGHIVEWFNRNDDLYENRNNNMQVYDIRINDAMYLDYLTPMIIKNEHYPKILNLIEFEYIKFYFQYGKIYVYKLNNIEYFVGNDKKLYKIDSLSNLISKNTFWN